MIILRLMGGLGNQMFQYASLRAFMLENKEKGTISLKGITNKTHNVYSLDYFDIPDEIKVTEKGTIKLKFTHYLYGLYYLFLIKRKNGFEIVKKVQPFLNKFGIYCVPDGYIKLKNSKSKNKTMVGYFQSTEYYDKYRDVIKRELKVKMPVAKQNVNLLKEIKGSKSVCLHIRRGDYVGTKHEVCNIDYYLKAIEIMKEKVKDCKFFVFSDDIEWVKNNIDFRTSVNYVEGNNPNYEELRLMYSCKHFIISNSSFSWWAQYLTDNKNRITIAPSRWFQNANQKTDIYQDDWIIIDV